MRKGFYPNLAWWNTIECQHFETSIDKWTWEKKDNFWSGIDSGSQRRASQGGRWSHCSTQPWPYKWAVLRSAKHTYAEEKTGSTEVWTLCSGRMKYGRQNDFNSSYLASGPLKTSICSIHLFFKQLHIACFYATHSCPILPSESPTSLGTLFSLIHIYIFRI